MADLGLDESPIEEQLATGILGILSPAVQQVDSKITEVRSALVACDKPRSYKFNVTFFYTQEKPSRTKGKD